ncbi:Immunoglobulin superfamily DCC subclass member 4 [Stylophora pistillata]|uniref:Cell adhesion molecule-related/down-regulated by oncogenes n=1 Tax=Stylophora pistillata TaxID=50429 RepID=A0A2B4STA1_STYPI|nr:Immunoglobulin superfamily DCC subclass member 4 [Stylophora pistillata]
MSKKFHKEPQNTITWVGSIARFSCQIQHAVPVATLVWEKDGSPLEPSDRSVILKEGVLQIKDVRKTDEGNYSCVAENVVKTRRSNLGSLAVLTASYWLYDFDTDQILTVVYLVAKPLIQSEAEDSSRVRTSPQFLGEHQNITAMKGGSAVIECAATGYPLPKLLWKKVDKHSGRTYNVSNLTYGVNNLNFTNVEKSDEGQYECYAHADGKTISRIVWLSVTGDRPGPPVNVVALPLSSSSIVISWSPPVGNHIIGAYTLHYEQLGKPSTAMAKVISKDTHSYEVQELLGYTNYSLYVKAYAKAVGYESEVIVQRTKEDRPTRAPIDVKVSSQTPDSLNVEWAPPPRDYRNGIITKYVISYKEEYHKGEASSVEVLGQTLKKTVNGLSKGTSYAIRVAAATVKGVGPFSGAVKGRVLNQTSNVISPPTVWIADHNSSTAIVKWLPPTYGQYSVEEYHLFYVHMQDHSMEKGPFIVDKQQRTYILQRLSPGSRYLIKLMAWDGRTLGPPGATYVTTDRGPGAPDPSKDPLIPPRPIHLVCTVDSPTSILLTWQTPLSSGSTTHYTVTYFLRSRIRHDPIKRTVYSENIVLRRLTPGREYTISVQSHYRSEKEIFPGVSTAFKNCKLPLSELSSPPQNIKYEYLTVRSVELEWEAPLKPNGKLISFDILYAYNKSYPDSMWENVSYSLGFFGSKIKQFNQRLLGIKKGTEFYLKIRAENNHGFGPFTKIVTIKPPSVAERVGPNVTYKILPSSQVQVQLSWKCPRVFNALVKSFTILFTNDTHLQDDEWHVQTVSIPSSRRFPDIVTTTLYVKKTFIYVKVRAEYNDDVAGKWSKIVKIPSDDHSLTTVGPRLSELDDNPEMNIKLGIIIGCTISAFCIVVLLLFILWRNPCRHSVLQKSEKKANVKTLPPMNVSLPSHKQMALSSKQDNSGSTEETSASSGFCQCRCTCGDKFEKPVHCLSSMEVLLLLFRFKFKSQMRTNNRIPGSSDSSTPITQVFSQSSPDANSEDSGSGHDLRGRGDQTNSPGSSSSSLSVELHKNGEIHTVPYRVYLMSFTPRRSHQKAKGRAYLLMCERNYSDPSAWTQLLLDGQHCR